MIGFLDFVREQDLNVGSAYPFTWHQHISEEIIIIREEALKITSYIIPYHDIGVYVGQPGSFIGPTSEMFTPHPPISSR